MTSLSHEAIQQQLNEQLRNELECQSDVTKVKLLKYAKKDILIL